MEYKVSQIKLSPELAQQKIMSWCAYQERSQHETRQKLYQYGLFSEEVEAIIANLIGENFLSEERFALAFAGGKFRIKHWGRNKIKAELKKHHVSEYCIRKAINAINEKDYELVMDKIIQKKIKSIKHSDTKKITYTLANYLISRGFESDLVREKLSNLQLEK
jgi:regulatory protein